MGSVARRLGTALSWQEGMNGFFNVLGGQSILLQKLFGLARLGEGVLYRQDGYGHGCTLSYYAAYGASQPAML